MQFTRQRVEFSSVELSWVELMARMLSARWKAHRMIIVNEWQWKVESLVPVYALKRVN